MPTATHICIIGAGPAGSVAAAGLAHAGVRVTILESRVFPRVKVCGEYISPAATAILESLIPPRKLLAAGARRVVEMVLEVDGRRSRWRSPSPAWSLSRSTLDDLLLERARESGASVLQPAVVRRVNYGDAGAEVLLADGRTLDADLIVHADGCGRHDPAGAVPLAPNLIAHKCHLRLPEDGDAIVMRACPGAYVGTIGVEGGLATCALVARRDLMADFPQTDALVQHLWPQFHTGWRTTGWKSCGVPRSRYITPGAARSIRIGNAAAAVDPVGGEGIGLALQAGAVLGECGDALRRLAAMERPYQETLLSRVEQRIAREYRTRLRTRLPICQLAAWLLMRPTLVRALWPLALRPSLSFQPFYRLTGKDERAHRPAA